MPSSSVIAVWAKSTGAAFDQDLTVTGGSSGDENTIEHSDDEHEHDEEADEDLLHHVVAPVGALPLDDVSVRPEAADAVRPRSWCAVVLMTGPPAAAITSPAAGGSPATPVGVAW